ncbi:hypothetical protein BPOR_0286g00020 [Botrytis porri]|uniref:Uncharacterized protein n=1 Tax=Botrytis porri TaxID=87229 RepID=A0A4Z1KQ81_9HELO|nr:hypothetical protein BPOR_0286g00020 [Botrytis porri]
MSDYPKFDASRRVCFDTSVAKSPCNGPTVTRNLVNDEYHLRMGFSEKKMSIRSSLIPQSELEMSDQERCETKRVIRFEPETKAVRQDHHMNEEYYYRMVAIEAKIRQDADEKPQDTQNHIRFADALNTSPRESAEVTRESKTKENYRMVALESKMWKEANVEEQAGAEVTKVPHDMQRRVEFQDSVLISSRNSIKTQKNNAKNQVYDRMAKLETKIWIKGGENDDGDADDKSDNEMSSIEVNHFQTRSGETRI